MTSKKLICAVLTLILSLSFFAGCQPAIVRDISCDDVIAAYKAAGYEVFHRDTGSDSEEYVCYVKAESVTSGEYIFFHFFDTQEAARNYAKTQQWNILLWLYSVACFQPYWLNTETYGNIEYEYADSALIEPFHNLIN